MANFLNDDLGILDLEGSDGLVSVEGSPVLTIDGNLAGVRLPNLFNDKTFTSFQFFVPITAIMPNLNSKKIKNQSEIDFVVKLKSGGLNSSGVVIANKIEDDCGMK